MYPSDITGELSRQRIADLHTQADRQRLARNLPSRPPNRAAALRDLDPPPLLAAPLAAAGHTSGLVVPVHNPRFSLGLAGAPLPVMALLMAVGILTAGGYSLQAAHRRRLPAWVPGLLVGGASSNLLDRLLLGSVRDFVATPWAVINLADLAVLAAVIAAILAHLVRQPPADSIVGQEVHP